MPSTTKMCLHEVTGPSGPREDVQAGFPARPSRFTASINVDTVADSRTNASIRTPHLDKNHAMDVKGVFTALGDDVGSALAEDAVPSTDVVTTMPVRGKMADSSAPSESTHSHLPPAPLGTDVTATSPLSNSFVDTHAFATGLLEAGNISQEQFKTLTSLIKSDVSNAKQQQRRQSFSCRVPGNVNIHFATSARQYEAVAAVFNTAELLEKILVHLPGADLLSTAPRICQTFRQAIATSFLAPSISSAPDFTPLPFARLGLEIYGSVPRRGECRITSLKIPLMPYPHHRKFESLQLGRPSIRCAKLWRVYDEKGRSPRFPNAAFVQCPGGFTVGDLLRIIERDCPRGMEYVFSLSTDLSGDGEASPALKV